MNLLFDNFSSETQSHRKANMDSHEVYQKALGWFIKQHLPKGNSCDDAELMVIIFRVALLHPEIISASLSSAIRYRDAEGVTLDQALLGRINQHPTYNPKKRKRGAK